VSDNKTLLHATNYIDNINNLILLYFKTKRTTSIISTFHFQNLSFSGWRTNTQWAM